MQRFEEFSRSPVAGAKKTLEDGKNVLKVVLFDQSCPIASLMVWIGIYMAYYYGFAMNSDTVVRADDHIKIRAVEGRARVALFLVWLVGGVFAGRVIKMQCVSGGNDWRQGVWGVIMYIVLRVLSALVLAITQENWTISNATEFLNYLGKPSS